MTINASIWWRDLCYMCVANDDTKWFDNLFKWRIGSDNKAYFWIYNWLEEQSLAHTYSRLFVLSMQQNLLIQDMGIWEDGTCKWNLCWRKEVLFGRRAWKKNYIENLMVSIWKLIPRIVDGGEKNLMACF